MFTGDSRVSGRRQDGNGMTAGHPGTASAGWRFFPNDKPAGTVRGARVTTDQRYSNLQGRNILIVEDEVLVAMMMEDILLEHGCTPMVASEQKQALACLDDSRFDAAILDVNLNGAASFPIAEALRARGVPFAFSTGYDERVLREGFRDQAVIRKPFLPDKLLEVLCGLVPAR
jgi:CheY-like chemotaxis protein